jgi:hypothetical protein
MKIQGSQVELRAAHAEQREHRVERQLQVSITRAPPPPVADAAPLPRHPPRPRSTRRSVTSSC